MRTVHIRGTIYLKERLIKITNEHNLPEALYQFLSRDYYVGGDGFSTTQLIDAPQIVALKKAHADEIEEDAMDMVWSVLGNGVHLLMETHTPDHEESEVRLYDEIHIGDDTVKISGQVDNYVDGVISDYKVTSAWSIIYGSMKKKWTEQLNIYAHLHRVNGKKVTKLAIWTILRDWSKSKALYDKDYPQAPMIKVDIPLWDSIFCEKFIKEKVTEHLAIPRPCTDEEMWAKPNKYAVMKKGGKRATKVHEDKAEAEADATVRGSQFSVEARVGERTRCENYCSVSQFCPQHKEYLNGK